MRQAGRDMTDIYRLQDNLMARERELRALADSSRGMMGCFYSRPDGTRCMPYVSPNIEKCQRYAGASGGCLQRWRR